MQFLLRFGHDLLAPFWRLANDSINYRKAEPEQRLLCRPHSTTERLPLKPSSDGGPGKTCEAIRFALNFWFFFFKKKEHEEIV